MNMITLSVWNVNSVENTVLSSCSVSHRLHLYPKSIRLVVDVSGSVYRFSGYDGRLQRTTEAILMIMESFDQQRNFKVGL